MGRQMHVTVNHGSQNAFLRLLDDNFMIHQAVDFPPLQLIGQALP